MLLKKVCNTHTEIEKIKKETLELFGFKELMLVLDFMECHILNLWVK